MLNLDAIATKTGLSSADQLGGHNGNMPIENRGVSLNWLINFLKEVDRSRHVIVEDYQRRKYRWWWRDEPEPDPLPFNENVEMTPHFVVSHVIRPMTQAYSGPLFARVPEHQRGKPDTFVSHAWTNRLIGGSAFATLYALDSPLRYWNPVKYVWIDVVCYNQHRPESIADDMKRIVASIGRVGLPVINSAPFSRLWCLWELLCAHVMQAKVEVYEPHESPYELGFPRMHFADGFKSVERAATTLPEDREHILEAMKATFGSIRNADEHIRDLIGSMLSKESDKPWNKP